MLIRIAGETMKFDSFVENYCDNDEEQAQEVLDLLIKNGEATIIEKKKNKIEKSIWKSAKEEEIIQTGDDILSDEESEAKFEKEKKREGKLTYPSVEFDFGSLRKATEFQNFVETDLFLETEIRIKAGTFTLFIYECTDSEVNLMKVRYKGDNIVKAVTSTVDKAADTTIKTVDYVAKNVAVPTAQVVAKAGTEVTKTAVTTTFKAFSMIASTLIKGTKQAVNEIRTDADVLKAQRDLVEAKHDITKAVKSKTTGTSSEGIRINQ